MTATDYTSTIGTIAGDGKIHLAHGMSDRQTILCRFGRASERTNNTIAAVPEGADVCEVLHAHQIKMASLCKNCFSAGMRKRYAATIRTAISQP